MDTQELMSRMSENLSVRRAFGDAYGKDGLLVIPVALVAGGGGAGEGTVPKDRGRGPRQAPAAEEEDTGDGPEEATGSGSGGGFGGLVMPIGAYVVKGDQVRWVPAVDVTVVLLAGVSMTRFLARLWTRSRRQHAYLKGLHRGS